MATANAGALDSIVYDKGCKSWHKAASYIERIRPEYVTQAIADHTRPTDAWFTTWHGTELSPHLRALERWAHDSAATQDHPLYNTHHQRRLVDAWKAHGEPVVPPMALEHFTPWISKHADADEDQVRDHAVAFEKASISEVSTKLGHFASKFKSGETARTQRNLRRQLRKAFRQFNEQAAHVLKMVGKNKGQQYVSDVTRNHRKFQLLQQDKWISATKLIPDNPSDDWPIDENTGLPKTIALADCVRTAEHRFAELYTLVKGQELYFTGKGYIPLFVTLTAPARFHPSPAYGEGSWDGSSVTDSHEWFNENWQFARASLAKDGIKLDGFRVTEPHKDGCEHWHLMCYVKRENLANAKSTICEYFAHSEHAVTFKADFSKNVADKKATAASYMLKYLIKTMNSRASVGTSAANDAGFAAEADAADAWRSTWGIRSFQFFGVLFGKQTLWRELRRLEEQPAEVAAKKLWRAARGGRAQTFIAGIVDEQPAVAAIRERTETWTDPDPDTGETRTITRPGRIVGIEINKVSYITHRFKFSLETDYSVFHENEAVTVIHKSPSRAVSPASASVDTDAKRQKFRNWIDDHLAKPTKTKAGTSFSAA